MDTSRFDAFTKGQGRRTVVIGTFGALALTLFGGQSLTEGKPKKKKCKKTQKRCGKKCILKTDCCNCSGTCNNGVCEAPQRCVPDCLKYECGDDGCGRQCLGCTGLGQICSNERKCVCPQGLKYCQETHSCEGCCGQGDCEFGFTCPDFTGVARHCVAVP